MNLAKYSCVIYRDNCGLVNTVDFVVSLQVRQHKLKTSLYTDTNNQESFKATFSDLFGWQYEV